MITSCPLLVIMLMFLCQHNYLISPHLIIMLTTICHSCLLSQTLPPWLHFLYVQPHNSYFHFPFCIFIGPKALFIYL